MKITEIKIARTIQVKQYEPMMIEMSATLAEDDNAQDCAKVLTYNVELALGLIEETKKVEPKEVEKQQVLEKVTEPTPEKVTKKKVVKRTTKKKVIKKVVTVAYDRDNKAHKKEFADILNDNCEGWKDSDETKAEGKACSLDLSGVAMFDAKGDLLRTFEAQVIEAVGETEL